MQSKVTSTAVIVSEPPDHQAKTLIVEIDIDCPECGRKTIRIPGHHLKAIRMITQDHCDRFPEYTGGTVSLVRETSHDFHGASPRRPEDN